MKWAPAGKERHMKHYRQGDVLIEQVVTIPQGATPGEPKARWHLAEGEATGHFHSVDAADATLLFLDAEMEMYLRVHRTTEVTHQEHAPIILEPGDYRVGRQREYAPEGIRNVAD